MKKSIVVTGGHVTPALAVIQELLKGHEYDVYFYGRKYAFAEATQVATFEYETIRSIVPFFELDAPRFPTVGLRIISFVSQFVAAVFVSYRLLTKHKPACILSFGGYVGAPVILAAGVLNIPILIHEQTLVPGRANKLLSFFAKKICVSWEETISDFPKMVRGRCIVTGNPIRQEIRECIDKRKQSDRIRTIYITGGSTGAHRINTVIYDVLSELTSRYEVIHQCGDSHFHDFDKLLQKKETLSQKNKTNYALFKYLSNDQIAIVLQRTDILIGRAGANTIVEVAVLGIPTVLVPLPESAGEEQQRQAALIENYGAGVVLRQEDLTGQQLLSAIENIQKSLDSYQKHAKDLSQTKGITRHKTAHHRIVACCDALISGSRRVPIV